jgi:hypothetical protein
MRIAVIWLATAAIAAAVFSRIVRAANGSSQE